MPFVEHHCSTMVFLLAFGTSHEAKILVFGVPNAKNLAFSTPDANALGRYYLLKEKGGKICFRRYMKVTDSPCLTLI